MKRLLPLLLLPFSAQAAEEQDHSAHTVQPAAEQDHSPHVPAATSASPVAPRAMDVAPELQEAHDHMMSEHGASLNFLVLGERFEQLEDDSRAWELQGWLGYDRDKLWLKTAGAYDMDADATEHGEVQALYSRAVAPYWDLQAGLRRDDAGSATRNYAAFGVQGLAPYWFEVDAAAFVSEQGDFSTRLEVEYELRFTQKLLLQPRLELNYSFDDDLALGIGQGFSETAFGLRLRYEMLREFAPYIGIEWSRAYGATASLLRAAGRDDGGVSVVAGLRFWY